MVRIESFIKIGRNRFVGLEEWTALPDNPDYIEGAIQLHIDGVEIIGMVEWDDINFLWVDIAAAAGDLKTKDYTEAGFPDQNIVLSFKRLSSARVAVTVEYDKTGAGAPEHVKRQAVAVLPELLQAIQEAGLKFVNQYHNLVSVESGKDVVVAQQLITEALDKLERLTG